MQAAATVPCIFLFPMQILPESIGEAGALAVHPYQVSQCLLLVETDNKSAAVIVSAVVPFLLQKSAIWHSSGATHIYPFS